jgi:hypothetical protein
MILRRAVRGLGDERPIEQLARAGAAGLDPRAPLDAVADRGRRLRPDAQGLCLGRRRAAGPLHADQPGISSLMKRLAVVLGPYGIRCNSVLPCAIETDTNRADLATRSAKRAAIEARTPIGRVGSPDDVAGVVAFLCTEDARFMTGGEVLVVLQ